MFVYFRISIFMKDLQNLPLRITRKKSKVRMKDDVFQDKNRNFWQDTLTRIAGSGSLEVPPLKASRNTTRNTGDLGNDSKCSRKTNSQRVRGLSSPAAAATKLPRATAAGRSAERTSCRRVSSGRDVAGVPGSKRADCGHV